VIVPLQTGEKIHPVVICQAKTVLEEIQPPAIDRPPPRPKMSRVTVRQHKNHAPQALLKELIAVRERQKLRAIAETQVVRVCQSPRLHQVVAR
jgi:hypothetical protein